MLIQLLLVRVLRAADFNYSSSSSQVRALADFYYATNGQNWKISTNWLETDDVSLWHGIKVDGENIIQVSLTGNNLVGKSLLEALLIFSPLFFLTN